MEMLIKNEEMHKLDVLELEEQQIYNFVNRLKTGEYKVILYNEQSPILVDDTGIVEFIIDDLNENSKVELKNNDELVIHNSKEVIELTGYKEMSDYEIVARKYLDKCEGTLIIKDDEMQVEFREDNFINIEDKGYYDKCKNIINIDIFVGDESDPIWRMNWDAIIVRFSNKENQLWQRP